ncbi:MAG: WG repeat-containing protein [Bacteroidia bacterium]|nr:WG repeat-containing protein [Bacteroidia bacterium]
MLTLFRRLILCQFCLLLFLPLIIPSQDLPELIPFKKNGKWGYSDPNRKIILDPVFDRAEPFNDGIARVEFKGKPQWIDLKGLPASPPLSLNLRKKMGYEVIMKNDKYGVANTMKEVIIKPQYDQLKHGIVTPGGEPDFSKKLFLVKTGKGWGIVNEKNEEVVPAEYEECKPFLLGFALIRKKDKWGAYNLKGKMILSPEYSSLSLGNCPVFLTEKKITADSSVFGFYHMEKRELTPTPYKDAGDMYYGMAAILKDSLWGYLNDEGKEVTEFKFHTAGPFLLDSGKFALVTLNKRSGIIDQDGQYIIFPSYKAITAFEEGLFVVQDTLERWGLLNRSGSVTVPVQYEQVSKPKEGYIAIKTGGKWGILDKDGGAVVAPLYEGELRIEGGGLFSVYDPGGELIGYISFYGTEYWWKEEDETK